MKKCNTIQQLENRYLKFKSGCSQDTLLIATALMFIVEILIANEGKDKQKRQPTKWNKFYAKQMKSGKSIKEISRLYHKN